MQILKAHEMMEGDGVTVRRLFPLSRSQLVADPFVLWDDFSIAPGAGFPTHAHRGFEAITYLFDGAMNHADDLGNNSTVTGGGAQRFTAGKGIQHSEMPGDNGTTTGIQLWINLPRSLKAIDPAYQQVDASDIPEAISDGVTVREIVGDGSPLVLKTSVYYAEIILQPSASYRLPVAKGMQGVIYLQQGEVIVDGDMLSIGDALLVNDNDQPTLTANTRARIMVALGRPHHEPVRLSGGFVD
jgi:redox-sensitive bicupin YhaK (pirin superfamily)